MGGRIEMNDMILVYVLADNHVIHMQLGTDNETTEGCDAYIDYTIYAKTDDNSIVEIDGGEYDFSSEKYPMYLEDISTAVENTLLFIYQMVPTYDIRKIDIDDDIEQCVLNMMR